MTDKFLILVVDDNANNRFTLRDLLSRLPDTEIIEASSGEEALLRTIERGVHLILLDVQMPGMDGYETARHLQMTERTRNIPIVFLTAVFKSEEFARRGYAMGAVDYLTKPLDDNLFLNRMRLYQHLYDQERKLATAVDLLRSQELTLIQTRDAANAANRAKSLFLANMSHEIRTPMNAVLGFAQLLERDTSLSPSARNRVATILKSGEHLLAIINDILEMSRIEAGKVKVHSQSFDLHGLLNEMTDMFRLQAEVKGLAFSQDSAVDLPGTIVADPGKLRQILVNLLGNAIKFTNTGSIVLRAFLAGSGRIAVEVRDSGIGMTKEEIGTLFRPFVRTRSGEQAAGGTGLGLAISREYAHLMGGEITVKSEPGEASCFRLEFPAAAGSEPSIFAGTPRSFISLAPGQGEISVLVVDDLIANRKLLRDMLEPLGFIVEEASDGREALEKADLCKPRIILMDLVMPNLDGAEATRILRGNLSNDPPTIIGISASVFDTEQQRFLGAGIDAFIAKPFHTQELYDVLAQHAGVLFATGEDEEAPDNLLSQEIPTLDKMSPGWRAAFREALRRKNVTRIRQLGEEAKDIDPLLSVWLLEKASQYDLDSIKKLNAGDHQGAAHG